MTGPVIAAMVPPLNDKTGSWMNGGASRRIAVAALGLCLATSQARAETVRGIWTMIPDGGTAVKLAMVSPGEKDAEPKLFRISCDQWGAVDLVFFGEAGLAENQTYDLDLRINGQMLRFGGKTERAESGSLVYWTATVALDHPLFAGLAKAERLEVSINGKSWRLPTDQLDWSLEPFIHWCQGLTRIGR